MPQLQNSVGFSFAHLSIMEVGNAVTCKSCFTGQQAVEWLHIFKEAID
jgi:hypothetical protein